jgi:L-lysine 6-transaminase
MCAVDLPDAQTRGQVLAAMRDDEHVLGLPCGERSLRFRPALSITQEELQVAIDALGRVLAGLASTSA